jgi:phosphatidylglycerophosphate synthase
MTPAGYHPTFDSYSINIPSIFHYHHKNPPFLLVISIAKTEVTSSLWGFVMQRHGPKPVLAATLFGLLAGGILFPGSMGLAFLCGV